MFFSDWSGILWQVEYHFMSRRRTNPKGKIKQLNFDFLKFNISNYEND